MANSRNKRAVSPPAKARVRELAEFLWEQSPGHFGGALSKVLVSDKTEGARDLDFRISTYEPAAYVQTHVHEAKQQIYYFLAGEGLLEFGDKKQIVRPQQFIFIPPRVPHGLHNTGVDNLVFMVITTPVRD
ncbi:MAG: cupin domain-containing protein [Proteobacteria bacterium]|nr:cupin domain-containing protein [Pseudomonadota bacterium]